MQTWQNERCMNKHASWHKAAEPFTAYVPTWQPTKQQHHIRSLQQYFEESTADCVELD